MALGLLFVAGTRTSYLILAVLVAAPAGWKFIVSTPFRMRRMLAFLDPWAFRRDVGYQITESLISVGSGGVTGLGLGDGRQKLFFLPEAHTDFILSIVGEELGLLGVLFVIGAFAVLVWRGLRAAFRARDVFGSYLAFGITTMFGLQALVNIGVVLGSLPTKGLPLPFISYGGTSLVMSLFAAGVLANISARNPEPGDWVLPGARRRALKGANRRTGRRPAHRSSRSATAQRRPARRPPPSRLRSSLTRGRCGCWSRAAGPAATSIPGSRSPRRCAADRRRGGLRRHRARPRDHAGARGRLPARADEGQRPQAHGPGRPRCAGSRGCRGAFVESRAHPAPPRPDVVLGVGGYASGPLVFAAALLGYPTAIQEQNSLPGFTNRVLGTLRAPRVRRVRRGGGALRAPQGPFHRQSRCAAPFLDRAAARAPAATAGDARSILILGGSQGSRAVNELASGMVRVLDARGRLPPIVHQTGADEFERDAGQLRRARLREDRVDVRAVHRRHAGRPEPRRAVWSSRARAR